MPARVKYLSAARLLQELAARQHGLQAQVVARQLEHHLQEARVRLAMQLRRSVLKPYTL